MIESPEQLAALLRREHDAAEAYFQQIEPLQTMAFRYYEGAPLGNEVEGRSQIVLPDVQESIDYMTQSVLRTFTSAERVVEFEATDEVDEQAAEDATAAIDYEFMRRQDGYRVLNDVVTDGLLRKLGIIKACVEKRERVSRKTELMPPEAVGMLPENVEIEDVQEADQGLLAVTIKEVKIETRYTGYAVPTHEFRFSPDARHEDTANYVAHICLKTRGELVEMGFDAEQVYALPGYNRTDLQDHESQTLDALNLEESSEALQLVELCEEYARVDVDGDGIAERVRVFRVENEILRWQGEPLMSEPQPVVNEMGFVLDEMGEPVMSDPEQEVDENGKPLFAEGELAVETVDAQPFAVFCPFPRPHRLVGYSLADKVMDIQYLRTMLTRQMVDGMAFANLPRPIVSEQGSSDETLDDILNPIPGSPIRVRTPGAVVPMQNNFNIGGSLQAMEWATGERESRSGITRLNQGLDADALNKTATGTALMQAQGQQIEEFIARNLAETMARFFQKLFRMMREEGEPIKLKVDGEYRMVDPRLWPDDMCIRVKVGLGTNSKDKRIQARMAIYGPLTAAIEQGWAGREHAFRWFDGLVRDVGIGRGDDFMFSPDAEEAQQEQEQPDPALIEAQAKMQLEQAKVQAQVQLQRDKAEADIQTQREKHAMDMQVARERAELEINLAREKAAAEIQLARERAAADLMTRASVSQQRMGGDLDK